MIEEQTSNPQPGTWANLSTEEPERKPKVEFGLNEVRTIKFAEDFSEPKEYPGDNGVYYIFDVKEVTPDGDVDKVIMTSAWTLLRGLKTHQPLAGKTLKVVKKMESGKQNFQVTA